MYFFDLPSTSYYFLLIIRIYQLCSIYYQCFFYRRVCVESDCVGILVWKMYLFNRLMELIWFYYRYFYKIKVIFTLLELSLEGNNLGFIRIIRLLRVLRPLRLINKNPSMKLIVNSLLDSIKGIANVSICILLVWLFINLRIIFAIFLM